MSEESADQPMIVIGDRIVAWILGISASSTLVFLGWIGFSMVEVRTDLVHLNDQMRNFRDQRDAASGIVVERLSHLSERVGRLENMVEKMRHVPVPDETRR